MAIFGKIFSPRLEKSERFFSPLRMLLLRPGVTLADVRRRSVPQPYLRPASFAIRKIFPTYLDLRNEILILGAFIEKTQNPIKLLSVPFPHT